MSFWFRGAVEYYFCAHKSNICMWKTKFTSQKQYLLGILFSRYAKKTYIDQSILQIVLLSQKKTAQKLSDVAS